MSRRCERVIGVDKEELRYIFDVASGESTNEVTVDDLRVVGASNVQELEASGRSDMSHQMYDKFTKLVTSKGSVLMHMDKYIAMYHQISIEVKEVAYMTLKHW